MALPIPRRPTPAAGRAWALLAWTCASAAPGGFLPAPAAAVQEARTYADEGARELVDGVLRLRAAAPVGGEARVGNRTRVRLLLPEQWKWRTRTLFRKETAGRVRFSADGAATAQIEERRRGAPLIGDRLLRRPALWGTVGFDPDGGAALFGLFGLELSGVAGDQPLAGPAEIRVFDTLFPDPLGPEGPLRYRYAMDRVLTAPGGRRLQAVSFRAGGEDPRGTHGLIWFDADTGRPIRTLLRADAPLPLRTGIRGPLRNVPLLEKDALGEVDFLLLEYDPEPGGGHRPTSVRVDGRVSTFWGQAILPLRSEWTLRWGETPAGGPTPPEPIPTGGALADASAGLDAFVGELDRLSGPPPPPGPWDVVKGTLSSVRFNQVQGFNVHVDYPLPVGVRTVLHSRVEIPTSSFRWTGSVGLERGLAPTRSGVEVFSRLRDADPLQTVNGALSSISTLVTGYDDGNYFLARGARAWLGFGALPVSGFVSLFAERHDVARRRVFTSLLEPDTAREPPAALPVTEGSYVGVRTWTQAQFGEDPQRGILLVRLHGQAAVGTRDFLTAGTTTDLVTPLPGPFTLGLRVEVGVSAGRVPGQGRYYLGGVRTVRGYPAATASGPSVLVINAEVGTDLPLLRLVAFGDVGWTDSFDRLLSRAPLRALGAGFSVADGILRLEVAKGLSEDGVWKVHLATSGIF